MKANNEHEYHEEEEDDDSLTETEPSEDCEDDRCRGPQPPVWHCVDCDSSYCRYVLIATILYCTSFQIAYRAAIATVGRCKDRTSPRRKGEMVCLMRKRTHMWSAN